MKKHPYYPSRRSLRRRCMAGACRVIYWLSAFAFLVCALATLGLIAALLVPGVRIVSADTAMPLPVQALCMAGCAVLSLMLAAAAESGADYFEL